jgi:predicted esterase
MCSYLEGCLRSVTGHPDEALAVFERGLERGEWWRPDQLRSDPDLLPLQDDPRFVAVVEKSTRRVRAADAEGRPDLVLAEPEAPDGSLLVALHGGSGSAAEFATHWRAASRSGAVVAAPQSPLPAFPGGEMFHWPDPPEVARQLADHLATIRETHRVDRIALAGLSQGARTALWCALRAEPEPVTGVIAVAGAALDQLTPLLPGAAERGLRVWFVTGDRDFARSAVLAAHEAFVDAGIDCRLTEIAGRGHAMPPELDEQLPEMLAFVLGR